MGEDEEEDELDELETPFKDIVLSKGGQLAAETSKVAAAGKWLSPESTGMSVLPLSMPASSCTRLTLLEDSLTGGVGDLGFVPRGTATIVAGAP